MIFGYEAKNRKGIKILVGVFVIFLIVGVFYLVELKYFNEENSIENESNIEFGVGFANDYIEEAITDYLLTQSYFSWQIEEGSRNFCVVENLYPESELFPLYVWASCGEFVLLDGKVKELSGMSSPVKIDYPNEMSFYDLNRFSYQAPKDGSLYTESIREIFPPIAVERIFNFNSDNLNQKLKATASAGLKE